MRLAAQGRPISVDLSCSELAITWLRGRRIFRNSHLHLKMHIRDVIHENCTAVSQNTQSQHTINFLLLMILPMIYAERSEQNGISWLELISAGFSFLLCQIKISHARPLLWPPLTTLTCWTHAFLWPQLLTSDRTVQVFKGKFINPSFILEVMRDNITSFTITTIIKEEKNVAHGTKKCPQNRIKTWLYAYSSNNGYTENNLHHLLFPGQQEKDLLKNRHAICTDNLQLDACLMICKALKNYCRLSISVFAFIGSEHIKDTSNWKH